MICEKNLTKNINVAVEISSIHYAMPMLSIFACVAAVFLFCNTEQILRGVNRDVLYTQRHTHGYQ